MKNFFGPLALVAAIVSTASAEPTKFTSGAQQVAILELYTSEGCSSCPPAESWLNNLKASPDLWKHFVPVAFHVDYWNSLGWTDRWSSPEFSERQRDYAKLWRAKTFTRRNLSSTVRSGATGSDCAVRRPFPTWTLAFWKSIPPTAFAGTRVSRRQAERRALTKSTPRCSSVV